MLRIGSFALTHWFDDARIGERERPLKDTDYIASIEEYEEFVKMAKHQNSLAAAYPLSASHFVVRLTGGRIFEFDIAWPGTTNEELLNKERYAASPNTLLMLKLSHRYKKNSPHFLKTMRDIQFLRSKGAVVEGELLDILKRREAETYTYAHPSLSQNKQQFFRETDSFYKYEHDDIHIAVATEDTPAYTKFSMDGAEVKVSKKKWKGLDLRTQLLAGLEESYVLALERSLIPLPGVLSPKQAFDKALEKVCTSITSGWFREFCWENYDAIQELYDESYVEKFQAALDAGLIREFNAS